MVTGLVIRALRSWQFMAIVAAVAFGVAAAAAVAQAAELDAPTAEDGFGDVPMPAVASSEPVAPDGPVTSSGPAAPEGPVGPTRSLVWDPWATTWDPWAGEHAPAGGPRMGAAFADLPDRTEEDAGTPVADQRTQGGTSSETTARDRDTPPKGLLPVGVRIPAIAVQAPTIPLGLMANGEIEVPQDPDVTGWWAAGPAPGTPGPTVLLGHVNDWSGPAVFNGLHALGPGDEVFVDRADGTAVVYAVSAAALYDKDAFPTDIVYRARSDTSLLRLVTCGGNLDREDRSYDSNYVVFAEQVRIEQPDRQR